MNVELKQCSFVVGLIGTAVSPISDVWDVLTGGVSEYTGYVEFVSY